MILCTSEKFKGRAKEEIEKLKIAITRDVPAINNFNINKYDLYENASVITYSNSFNNDEIVENSLKIKNYNNNSLYIFSSFEKLEAIITYDNGDTVEKYAVELVDNDVIASRSLFVINDYMAISKNLTTSEITLEGTILNKITSSFVEEKYQDDMDYLKECMVIAKAKTRVRN